MARRAAERDPTYTVQGLLEAPIGGFGEALDTVVHLSNNEKLRLTDAFVRTFIRSSRLERTGS